MVRLIALMALVGIVGAGCTVKVSSGAQPNYDYSDYESYDQPHNISPDGAAALTEPPAEVLITDDLPSE